jgi:hypothetical protein
MTAYDVMKLGLTTQSIMSRAMAFGITKLGPMFLIVMALLSFFSYCRDAECRFFHIQHYDAQNNATRYNVTQRNGIKTGNSA